MEEKTQLWSERLTKQATKSDACSHHTPTKPTADDASGGKRIILHHKDALDATATLRSSYYCPIPQLLRNTNL